jgi:hypothetical protein
VRVLLKLEGQSALVMHNERLADPLDEFARAIGKVSKKRNKTEADHMEIGRLEFYGGLYANPVILGPETANGQAPVLPAWNIIRCLQYGAKKHKKGADVLRGVYPLVETVPVIYEGPQSAEELWKDGGFSLRKTVGISGRRTVRTRPIFHDWQAELPVEVDSTVFDLDTLCNVWKDAGVYAGLGEMRPVFGRFTGLIEKES